MFSDVFLYWKDKCITEDGRVLVDYGYDGCNESELVRTKSVPVIEDWGEPCCFGCGRPSRFLELEENEYEEILNIESNEEFAKRLWGRKEIFGTSFERAHIVPKSLGGSEDASNMFCLCKLCHRDSPDTRFPQEFFRWVYKKRQDPPLMLYAYEECKHRNIFPLFCPSDFDVHKNITSHGGRIEASSYVATFVGCAEERTKLLAQLADLFHGSSDSVEIADYIIEMAKRNIRFPNNVFDKTGGGE